MLVPSRNGSNGVFLALNVRKGGCNMKGSPGMFALLDLRNDSRSYAIYTVRGELF